MRNWWNKKWKKNINTTMQAAPELSRRSRRKTLSHLEIDEFLSSLGSKSSEFQSNNENILPNLWSPKSTSTSKAKKITPNKVLCSAMMEMENNSITELDEKQMTQSQTDEELIRRYCKVSI